MAANFTACWPDPQNRLSVTPGASSDQPASSAAMRAMSMAWSPTPAPLPMITSSTSAVSKPMRSRRAFSTWARIRCGCTPCSAPVSLPFPRGERTASMIHASRVISLCPLFGCRRNRHSKVANRDRHRAPGHVDGRRRPPGPGRADRASLHLGRVAERDLRDPPRRPARRAAHPAAAGAGRAATTASCASGGSSKRSTAPTCRTRPPSRPARTRRCSAGPST